MWIQKGKLCEPFQVWDKPNLDNIFKSYLSYHDLQSLRNSLEYFERLRNNLFLMIRQLGPLTFFVTFTYTKRLWDPFIKALHTLHALRLNIPNKIKYLQSFPIA
jgi:hypothetical protein